MLDPVDARVLGCLLEKEVTTPEVYPLTLNALVTAANQSTNREPVMRLEGGEIERSLMKLKGLGLIRVVHSPSNRATKFRQVLDEVMSVSPGERAVVCLLLLRGAQTPGELRSRSERLCGDLADVDDVLDALAGREPPVVARLERAPGQREARWIELLSDVANLGTDRESNAGPRAGGSADRIAQLEARVEELETQVAELRQALGL
jgi:uncharacterized protein YceH (UPF0502 family)